MKHITLSLIGLCLLGACKKEATLPVPEPVFPEGRYMTGMFGKDSFNASSMDAHIQYHTTSGQYTMGLGVMDKKTGQIMAMNFKDFIYGTKQYDLPFILMETDEFWKNNYTSTTFDNNTFDNAKSGSLKIYDATPDEIKGTFHFMTAGNKLVEGIFRYQLIYPVDTVE